MLLILFFEIELVKLKIMVMESFWA